MSSQWKQIQFIKEVAKYFMDFLETDFHKKKAPKRSIVYSNSKWYLIWVNLSKYNKINDVIWKTVNKWFDKESFDKIKKGTYNTQIPKDFIDVIKLNVNKISQEDIQDVIDKISDLIIDCAKEYDLHIDEMIDYVLLKEAAIFKQSFVSSFLANIQDYIISKKLWDESSIFMMEDNLSSILVSWTEELVKELVKKVIVEANDNHSSKLLKESIKNLTNFEVKSKNKVIKDLKEQDKDLYQWWITSVDIKEQLTKILNLDTIKTSIIDFFESLKVWDLFLEVSEINRNKAILENQEFYLYFWDIFYQKTKYPIFYIPFKIEKWESTAECLQISFWSQIYVNKKALEFIVQEYNEATNNATHLKTIWERIMYVADWEEINCKKIQWIFDECIELFKLSQRIDITNSESQVAKWELVRISNNCYISLFDRSDEALINDYEEIITKINEWNSELWEWFSKLIDDFIYNDPKKITFDIKEEWEDKKLADKLIYHCPIPLNQEQQQIVSATKREDCKYIIVQGPPGTWKSHTITAVVFDQILKGNSVLVLSDKKEALDVVEDKITETMNTVRINDDFQNPILRLWKTWNTYAEILNAQHIEKIINSYFAARWKKKELEENVEKKTIKLKENITAEKDGYERIFMSDIKSFFELKKNLKDDNICINEDELLNNPSSYSDLVTLRNVCLFLKDLFAVNSKDTKKSELFHLINLSLNWVQNLDDLKDKLNKLNNVDEIISSLKSNSISEVVEEFGIINENNFKKLKELSVRYENERTPVIWFLFKKNVLLSIRSELENEFWYTSTWNYDTDVRNIRAMIKIINKALESDFSNKDFDYIQLVFKLLKDNLLLDKLWECIWNCDSLSDLSTFEEAYPETLKEFWIKIDDINCLMDNDLVNIEDEIFEDLLEYIRLNFELKKRFSEIEYFDYNGDKKEIETLATMEMTRMMDESLAKFYEEKKNTAMAIKKIIQKKIKFPKEEFSVLKKAFPCILAWIRDYAEYIPLEPEMFDIVIIDEASQVSIAQAFPALLRAKKILVLWDKKQFSNVKTSLASIKENREYLNKIRESFVDNVSNNQILIEKSEMFDIKNSILDFCERICNYEVMLKKYFRWYKEIISYSNKFFYGNDLQVMKIRWKNIDDVLRFEFVDANNSKSKKQNTNYAEIEFIIQELNKLKESWIKKSVWIITPHTNQQKALSEEINKIPESFYFYEKLNLKIMTFDSCQWEERDIIYYSMVATKDDDKLRWVFIKDMWDIDNEEEWKLKAQRLNVWFSRPKETMVFVLSKPINEFNWEIRKTLSHYREERERCLKSSEFSDKIDFENNKILNILNKTAFYQNNSDNVKILSNFQLSEYLQQLDPYYNHPKYKSDFLIVYTNEKWKDTKIFFEYDDFETAEDLENIKEDQLYLNENDVYMEKVLESYWYKYLRVNDFILWNNPVRSLNSKFEEVLWLKEEYKSEEDSAILQDIQKIAQWLEDWTFKICDKCGEVKELAEFKDSSLKSWYGRQCLDCKVHKRWNYKKIWSSAPIKSPTKCPKCGAKMVLRHSRFWDFYWCSNYPICTRIVWIQKWWYIKF